MSETKINDDIIILELGDIIELNASSNDVLHEHTFFIKYINNERVVIINVASLVEVQLNRDKETGVFSDESIEQIVLVSRSENQGYARQNNLILGTWIEIYIDSDVSTIITGEITSVEEDQIEVRTLPELDTIYIDFEYKGLPENIPITKIVIRDEPIKYNNLDMEENEEEKGEYIEPNVEYLETGEMIINSDENMEEQEDILETLRKDISKSKGIVFGDDLEDVEQMVEISERYRRYGIDLQTSSLLDELMSTIPTSKRNPSVLKNIHTLISRYRELREIYSRFDDNGDIIQYKRNDPQFHKPLVDRIKNQDTKIDWLLPVVSLKKKVYTDDSDNINIDVENYIFDDVIEEEENIKKNTYYNERTFTDESKYYKLYEQLADLMQPFEDPINKNEYLNAELVKTNLETIVDNQGDFYSAVVEEGETVKKRYIIQKYSLGLNKRKIIKRGDDLTTETSSLTPAEKMYVKSYVMLPEPVVHWSRINMPQTSILEKSNIHHFPLVLFKILRKNKDITPYIIDDLEKDIYNEDNEGDEFLSSMRHYTLSDTLQKVELDERFDKFLKSMIPKTKTLIKLIRKYITQKLSFVSVVQGLEQFHVYSKDITYKQYLEIRRFIMDKIVDKKKEIEDKRKEFGLILGYRHDEKNVSVLKYFAERPEFLDYLIDGYQLPSKELLVKYYSNKEILEKCISMDKGVFLSLLIQNMMSSLRLPTSLVGLLDDDYIDNLNKEKQSDCLKRVLTKKYKSTEQLQKDNGKDIYYDKEYDETPYNILDNYKDERRKMQPDVFERLIIEILNKKYSYQNERANELAKILIVGKKTVKDGEFAVVIITPEIEGEPENISERRKMLDTAENHKKSIYYHRKNDVWVRDKEIDDEAFIDTQDLFCNIQKDCIKDSEKCSSMDEVSNRIRMNSKSKMNDEINNRFEIADEDEKASLKKKLVEQLRFINRWKRIQSVQSERINNIAYQIGMESTKYTDSIISPYIGLLNRITSQTDFVKKQGDIIRLYEFTCREPMELLSEDVGWKYCRISNTKFLPAFLYDLAKIFVDGGDYGLALDEMCHTHGLLSDAGDAIVDKYSGRTIRAIDFANEDGYDDSGFKISTHAFLQKGEVEKAVGNILDLYQTIDNKPVYEGEQAQMVSNLLEGIAKQIGHPLKDIKSMCVRITLSVCGTLIGTEDNYIKNAKKTEENKGIRLPSYKKRSQQLTLLITASIFFMIIQTDTIPFNTSKSMPGCVKSFKGFPLSGEENMTGLNYMACVISKMEKKIEPWNTLDKMTLSMIQEQMKKIVIASLKNVEISELYLNKREYMIINNDTEISEEHKIDKWSHFLPPLSPISIAVDSVSSDFKDQLLATLKNGTKHQHNDLMALESKIAQMGFSIISAIQTIVNKKELILLSNSSGTPFLQNVCCNEKDRIPISYFSNEDSSIERYIKSTNTLGKFLKTIKTISKPSFLIDPRGRKWEYPPISQEITETIIYATFIHYCQLDKGKGVPKRFHLFFTDVPDRYPVKASLDEKIDFLKRSGKNFTIGQFKELLQIINRENIISFGEPTPYHRSEILKDLMSIYSTNESPVIDDSLREDIMNVLENYDKSKLVSINNNDDDDIEQKGPDKEKIAALKVLKNNLAKTIKERFKPNILSFLKKNSKLSPKDFSRLTEFFDTFVSNWATNDIYQVANFIKNTIYEWTSVFPNILITNVKNSSRVHNYWGLAPIDASRINKSNYTYFEPLGEFREDPIIKRVLEHVQPKFVDLRLFFQHLPIQEAIRVGGRDYYSFFDKDTVNLLFEYIYLSVLHEYIDATEQPNILELDRIEKKRKNRSIITQSLEPEINMEFQDLDEEYEEVYGNLLEIDIQVKSGNRAELKTRVSKLVLAFINITRKNKNEINISYDNISASIRKKKEKEKNRIVERFKNMSEDERKVEDMKKKLKLDEWNVGTQKGIFIYDKSTSTREVLEQGIEDDLDIQKHGMRKNDFINIFGDTDEIERDTVTADDMPDDMDETADQEDISSGLSGLKKNFSDGQYYSDDESDDDFGDES